MTSAITAGLLLSGLLCFWVSLNTFTKLDSERPDSSIQEPQKDAEEEVPRVTRPGRPVREIRLRV